MCEETYIRRFSLLIFFVWLFIHCYRIFRFFSSSISSSGRLSFSSLLFIPIRINILLWFFSVSTGKRFFARTSQFYSLISLPFDGVTTDSVVDKPQTYDL